MKSLIKVWEGMGYSGLSRVTYKESLAPETWIKKLVREKCSGMLNVSLTFYMVLLALSSASHVFLICSSDTLVK